MNDINFITRVIKTSIIVTFIVALFTASYYNISFALGLVVGSFWNITNFWFIKGLVTGYVSNKQLQASKLVILVVVKFPLLYAIGYWIVRSGKFTSESLLCGFSLLFAVLILKAFGILIISKNNQSSERNEHK